MKRCRARILILLLLATASTASADPIVTAHTHRIDHLYRLELTGTGGAVSPQPAGKTGVDGICALAEGPEDSFFAAVTSFPGPDELWRIDRQTLTSVTIGELGVELQFFADLASDEAGGLWLAADGTLHSVDTETGKATAVGGAADLVTVAFDGGTLYGITGSGASGWTLVVLDPVTGDQTAATDLEFDIVLEGLLLFGPRAMDFDDLGGLWVLVEYGSLGDPPFSQAVVHYFAEPLSGAADSLSVFASFLPWKPLVVTGTELPVIDVPALGSGGLAAFALLLASAALIAVRRAFSKRRLL